MLGRCSFPATAKARAGRRPPRAAPPAPRPCLPGSTRAAGARTGRRGRPHADGPLRMRSAAAFAARASRGRIRGPRARSPRPRPLLPAAGALGGSGGSSRAIGGGGGGSSGGSSGGARRRTQLSAARTGGSARTTCRRNLVPAAAIRQFAGSATAISGAAASAGRDLGQLGPAPPASAEWALPHPEPFCCLCQSLAGTLSRWRPPWGAWLTAQVPRPAARGRARWLPAAPQPQPRGGQALFPPGAARRSVRPGAAPGSSRGRRSPPCRAGFRRNFPEVAARVRRRLPARPTLPLCPSPFASERQRAAGGPGLVSRRALPSRSLRAAHGGERRDETLVQSVL